MTITIAPFQPGLVGDSTIIDILESSIGAPVADWSPKFFRSMSRARWTDVYYSVESLYDWHGGYDWRERDFKPFRKNIHVPFVYTNSADFCSVYLNTFAQSSKKLIEKIKKCLLYYERIYIEEPISQLKFDHGFAPIIGKKRKNEIYRLYFNSIDVLDREQMRTGSHDLRSFNDSHTHYEGIRYWALFYKEIADLIRAGIVIPVSNHGDFYNKYLHCYDRIDDERAFDKEDGFRNTEDVILSHAVNKTYNEKIVGGIYRDLQPEAHPSDLRLRYIELILGELILSQFDRKLIPELSLSTGKVAFEVLRTQLLTHHRAKFEKHAVEAQMVANYVPDPKAISVGDLMAVRANDEVFARWRDCISAAANRASRVQSAEQAEAFSREVLDTRLSWNSDLDIYLGKSNNLASVFKSFGIKAVVGIFSAAGIGWFSGSVPAATAAAGGYLSYDALMTINEYLRARRSSKMRFRLTRLYGAFEKKR